MDTKLINKFKERDMKAKDIFEIKAIKKNEAKAIIEKYHYLGKKDFMFTIAYGLFEKGKDELLGCAVFGVVGGALALKSHFGVDNTHSNEYLELTRLVMNPNLNGCNATSFLLGNSIKIIKRDFKEIKAIVSLADNTLHNGAIYQSTNFKYYGLTNKKTDFVQEGTNRIGARCGSTKDKHGVWLPRSRKHIYIYIIDKGTIVNHEEQPYPKGNDMNENLNCCGGSGKVYDKRFSEWFSCPKCVGKCERINVGDLSNK